MFLFILVVLTIFTVVSILYQIKKLQKKIQKWDKFGIVPNYSFFAPMPLLSDYRIAYKITNREEQEWEEVPIYIDFNFFRTFWNPFKYYNKGLIDSCHFLIGEYHALENKKVIQLSIFYLNILSLIADFLKDKTKEIDDENTIRFSIISSKGMKDIIIDKIIFASYNQIV